MFAGFNNSQLLKIENAGLYFPAFFYLNHPNFTPTTKINTDFLEISLIKSF